MRSKAYVRSILSLLLPLSMLLGGYQAALAETDEDALFGSFDLVEDVTESNLQSSLHTDLLTNNGVEIGGRYSFTLNSTWSWLSPEALRQNPGNPSKDKLDTTLQATLYLDARPDSDYRVFGKARINYPFAGEDRNFDDVVHVTELFSDFNSNDKVFFRAGKQTIDWGVGYFFSPADIINTSINPADPDAEREGPLSVKANMPLGANNLYLYILAPQAQSVRDLGLAPKAELVLGPAELGVGAYFQRSQEPVVMATLSSALGDVAVFAEGVAKSGLSGTGGFRYAYSDDKGLYNLGLAAQYLYDGEKTTAQKNRHMVASALSWRDMLGSGVSTNFVWLGNLNGQFGSVTGSVSWEPVKRINTTLGVSYSYSPIGNPVDVFVRTSFGSGQF